MVPGTGGDCWVSVQAQALNFIIFVGLFQSSIFCDSIILSLSILTESWRAEHKHWKGGGTAGRRLSKETNRNLIKP